MGGESRAAAPPRRMGAGWPHARRGRMPPRPSARHGQQERCRRRGVASAGCRRAVRHTGRRTCRSRGAPGAATTAAASPPPHLRPLAGGRAASLERGGVAMGRHEQRGPACSTVQTHSKFVKIVVFGEAPRPLNTSKRKKEKHQKLLYCVLQSVKITKYETQILWWKRRTQKNVRSVSMRNAH